MIDDYEKSYGKEGIMELARKNCKTWCSFKTPVFDGAKFEEDIKPLLQELALPDSMVHLNCVMEEQVNILISQ